MSNTCGCHSEWSSLLTLCFFYTYFIHEAKIMLILPFKPALIFSNSLLSQSKRILKFFSWLTILGSSYVLTWVGQNKDAAKHALGYNGWGQPPYFRTRQQEGLRCTKINADLNLVCTMQIFNLC